MIGKLKIHAEILAVLIYILLTACSSLQPPLPSKAQFAELVVDDLEPNVAPVTLDWNVSSKLTIDGVNLIKGEFPLYMADLQTQRVSRSANLGHSVQGRYFRLSPSGDWCVFKANEIQVVQIGDGMVLETVIPGDIADWSTDGQQLAVLDVGSNGILVHIFDREGENIESVFEMSGHFLEGWLDWSPDQKFIAFSLIHFTDAGLQKQEDIYVISAHESILLWKTSTQTIDERHPSWSPNNRCLLFAEISEKGTTDTMSKLVLMDIEGFHKEVITTIRGVSEPSWSPDGTQIAAIGAEGVYLLNVVDMLDESVLAKCVGKK